MWVLGGFGEAVDGTAGALNEVLSSADGKTWEEKTAGSSAKFIPLHGHTSVVFDDDDNGEKIWLIGGIVDVRVNSVWNSTDGKTWPQVRRNSTSTGGFLARSNHTAVVFDKKMWVLGGSQNNGVVMDDVWSSTNGITWEDETDGSSKKFTARAEHKSVVFNDGDGEKIWVFGGRNGTTLFDDVWSSADGKNWTEVTKDSSEKFTARYGHHVVVFDGKMWVFGGNISDTGGFDTLNDVWRSDDGKNWTKVRSDDDTSGFTARSDGTAVFFDNKVWLIAGRNASARYLNDVWSMIED
jgi:hypothetical protein